MKTLDRIHPNSKHTVDSSSAATMGAFCGKKETDLIEAVPPANQKRRRLSVGVDPEEVVADREDTVKKNVQVERMEEIFAMFPNTQGGRRYSLAG